MNRARNELFPRAALSFDQHRARYRGDLLDLYQHLPDGLGLANQSGERRQLLPVKDLTDAISHVVEDDGLRVQLHETDRPEPLLRDVVEDVRESNHGDVIPEKLADELTANLERHAEAAEKLPRRPRVFFEEWHEPLISGIRWCSELVELVGGEDVCRVAQAA